MVQEQIKFLSEKTARLSIRISEFEIEDESCGKVGYSAHTKYLYEELNGFKSVLNLLYSTKQNGRNIDVQVTFMCNKMSELRKNIFNAKKELIKREKIGLLYNNQVIALHIDAMQKEYDCLVSIFEHIKRIYIIQTHETKLNNVV